MSDDPRLLAVLEEILENNRSPEDACRDCPELLPRVHERLRQAKAMPREARPPALESPPRAGGSGDLSTTPPGAEPPSDQQKLPERLGRYRITGRLGSGGFGAVYRGFDEELRRDVAIKVPHREHINNPKDIEAYLTEARVLAGLDHAHIVPPSTSAAPMTGFASSSPSSSRAATWPPRSPGNVWPGPKPSSWSRRLPRRCTMRTSADCSIAT